MTGRIVTGAAALVLALTLPGCAGDNEGGLGIPTENLVDPPAAAAQPIAGQMQTADNGCFHLVVEGTAHYVVWPAGFTQDAADVVATDGSRYTDGDGLAGTGWVRPVADVVAAADGPDGYLDSITGYCVEEGEQVVVFASLDNPSADTAAG